VTASYSRIPTLASSGLMYPGVCIKSAAAMLVGI
jgi:hypothetical protein